MSQNKFSTTDLLHAIREIPKTQINYMEKYVLIILLSCMNIDNATWYSMEMIAEFSGLNRRSINRYTKTLEQKRFIFIDKPTSYTHNQTNTYHLNVDLIMGYHPVNKSRIVNKSRVSQSRNNEVACPLVTPSSDSESPNRVTISPTKIDIEKDKKKERSGKEIPAPLSEDFQASRATKDIVYEMGFTREDMELAFPDFYRHYYGEVNTLKGWDMKFRGWMRQKRKYDDKQFIKNQPSPTERKDPFKEEELKMKRFGGLSTVGNLVK